MTAEFAEPVDRHNPDIGSVVAGRYRILEPIGRGGMGSVFKAEHVLIGRIVALKMLLEGMASDASSFRRFHQEARAASTLDHPNIVAIHDFGQLGDDQAYLTMDYIPGRTLDEVIKRDGFVSVERFRHIFTQACDALEHAHAQGMVHRDIKPSNLMLVEKGSDQDFLKIVDFGLVKLMSGAEPHQKLTSSQTLIGSPLYMSPEQCRGLDLDHRSDIYSLGCVMYLAISGAPPVMGETALDTLYRHVSVEPEPFSVSVPTIKVPEALERVIRKALEKKPEDRQQSMAQLKVEILATLSVPSQPQRKPIADTLGATRTLPPVSQSNLASLPGRTAAGPSVISGLVRPTSFIAPASAQQGSARNTALSRANAAIACKDSNSIPLWEKPLVRLSLVSAFLLFLLFAVFQGLSARQTLRSVQIASPQSGQKVAARQTVQSKESASLSVVDAQLASPMRGGSATLKKESVLQTVQSSTSPARSELSVQSVSSSHQALPANIQVVAQPVRPKMAAAVPAPAVRSAAVTQTNELAQAFQFKRTADEALASHDFVKARSAYAAALALKIGGNSQGSEYVAIVGRLAACCWYLGDFSAAKSYYDRFSDLFARYPKSVASDRQLLLTIAEMSEQLRDPEMTERMVNSLLLIQSQNTSRQNSSLVRALISVANHKALKGDSKSAEDYFKWAVSLANGNPHLTMVSRVQYAAFLRRAGRHEEADLLGPIRQRLRNRLSNG